MEKERLVNAFIKQIHKIGITAAFGVSGGNVYNLFIALESSPLLKLYAARLTFHYFITRNSPDTKQEHRLWLVVIVYQQKDLLFFAQQHLVVSEVAFSCTLYSRSGSN